MSSKLRLVPFVGALAMAPVTALGQGGHDHNHGEANLTIVTENNPVTIEFTSDLWNLVGFERAPNGPEELAEIDRVRDILENDPGLISFNTQAGCERQSVKSNFDVLFADSAEKADHHDSDHHDHDHERHKDHDHEDGHDHEAHDDHDDHEGHLDHSDHDEKKLEVMVSYEYVCERSDRLRTLTVGHFPHFSLLEEIKAIGFTANKQLYNEFRSGKTSMDLN